MTLHLHVSNNDIAYKYEMSRPKKDNPKSVIIYNEVSGFNFPEKTTTFLCPQITPMTGWDRTKPSYEEEYTPDAPLTPRQIMNNSITRKKEMAWMKKLAGCATVGVRLAQECTNCMGGYQVYCRLSYQVCGGGSQVERREWFRCSTYSRQMVRRWTECYRQASCPDPGFADVCR